MKTRRLAPAYDAAVSEANEPARGPDLSVTALYTAQTWAWGGLEGAELLASPEGQRVFDGTNFALAVARPFQSDARSLKHALVHRHTLIDALARRSDARQILEVAAGLSRRGVAFSSDPELSYVEVDLDHVVAHKRKLLERTEAGRAALARPNLRLVAGDARTLDLAPLVDTSAPLFVVAEGLLMYLPRDEQLALFERVRSLFGPAGGTFVFDLVPSAEEPKPGAAGRALGWLMRRFTRGKGFERDGRTRDDIAGDLAAAGFEIEILEPATIAHAWSLPYPDEPTRMVVFVGRVAPARAG